VESIRLPLSRLVCSRAVCRSLRSGSTFSKLSDNRMRQKVPDFFLDFFNRTSRCRFHQSDNKCLQSQNLRL
jgi:hypothetical protein